MYHCCLQHLFYPIVLSFQYVPSTDAYMFCPVLPLVVKYCSETHFLCRAKCLHCSSVKFIMQISNNASVVVTNIICMIMHRVMFEHQHFLWSVVLFVKWH